MANTKHAVVNTELMSATDVRSNMRSFRIGTGTGTAFVPVDADNGTLVTLNGLLDQDLWEANFAAKTAKLGDIVLVTTPEICYDERDKTLDCFYNIAGTNATGMILVKGDIYSITQEGFEGTTAAKVGDFVGVGTNGKQALSATAPSSGAIGKIIDVKYREGVPYFGVLVG